MASQNRMIVGGTNSPQLPDHVHDRLIWAATRTATFLTNLTEEHEEFGGVKRAAMPKTAFKNVKALAFVFRRKWGCIAGYTQEVGFITRRLVSDDGTVTWSPPLFTKGLSISMGITLGYSKSGTCLALMNEEAITNIMQKKIKPGITADFLVDMNGAKLRKARIDSTWTDDNVVTDGKGGMLAKYFRLEAMLVDGSLRAGIMGLNDKLNNCLYGDTYTAEDVLLGKFPRPIEFFTVYEILNKCSASARPQLKTTASLKGTKFQIDVSNRGDRSGRNGSLFLDALNAENSGGIVGVGTSDAPTGSSPGSGY